MLAKRWFCLAAALVLTACTGAVAQTSPGPPAVGGPGPMPAISDPPAVTDPPPVTSTVTSPVTSTVTSPPGAQPPGAEPPWVWPEPGAAISSPVTVPDTTVGEVVGGNRVLALGDSILASISRRYSNDLCEALVPFGWDVEVEAESGRFVTFGRQVLRRIGDRGPWDVVIVGFGSNYANDPLQFRREIEQLIADVQPAAVVLVTVTPFQRSRNDVNQILRDVAAAATERVTVMDWAAISTFFDGYVGGDRLHLTDRGREGYAAEILTLLGPAPQGVGECRRSAFTDDSAGPVRGSSPRRP